MTRAADLRRGKQLLSTRPDLLARLLKIADDESRSEIAPIYDARSSAAAFGSVFDGLADEELHALYLDRRHRLISVRRLTVGSDRFTVVDPRQIFRPGVQLAASAVILAHNHPSGDPTPSAQDREVTRRVTAAGKVLGITLLDHIVFGSGSWVSMRESGDMSEGCSAASSSSSGIFSAEKSTPQPRTPRETACP